MPRLGEDTAWHPLLRENYDCLPLSLRPLFDAGFGPLRPWLSVGHWYASILKDYLNGLGCPYYSTIGHDVPFNSR